jgi:DnaK suppressor protein
MSLSKKDLEKYRENLEIMKKDISKSISGAVKEVKTPDENGGYSQHQADHGTDDFERSVNLELTNKEFEILRQIDKALVRIQENTYGTCEVSGKDIPKKRLDVIPYATMTVESQEMVEKGQF